MRVTLSARLSLAFALLLLASAAASAWLQIRANALHEQELVQRLSSDVAAHIAGSAELMDENGLKPDAVRILFGTLMSVNPSVEVYLLDARGKVVGHAAPPGHVRRDTVDVEPIERLLAGESLPIFGDDPRSQRGAKVFSAAPLQLDGRNWGYVYVILVSEARDLLAADVAASSVLPRTLWSMAVVALAALAAGLIAFRLITRPLRALTNAMQELDVDRVAMVGEPPPAEASTRGARDEIAILDNAFRRMATRIAEQWRTLTRQDRDRRELVANVSHDLRTPLTSLHGYLETLAAKGDSLTAAERRRYLDTALAQSAKVGRLARELFDLARLEYEAAQPVTERFALPDLVQDVLQKVALQAQRKEQTLVADVAPDIHDVRANLAMIERALTNLLDNALRHTPERGTITIELRNDGARVAVGISDTGPGIPPEVQRTMFQRPSALTGDDLQDRGGLGLLIVHRILALHGSSIELQSEPGKGAVFRFRLDAAER
jgi:signal transduction histidine kinase